MTMILGKRPTGGIVIDQLIMAIDPSNSMCYRPGVSSTAIRDISGKNADATTVGTNYVTTAGGGFDINTTAKRVTSVGSPLSASAVLSIGSDFSMGMWVYMNTLPSFGGESGKLCFIYPTGDNPSGVAAKVGMVVENSAQSNGASVQAFVIGASAVRIYVNATAATFQYWVMTWNQASTTLSLYRNGTFQTSQTTSITSPLQNKTAFFLAGTGDGTAPPQGQFYSAHIYNKSLSAAEVSQNFEATRARFGV